MNNNKEYFSFISYKSEDAEWAIWLQHELEHYKLPATLINKQDIRKELRPVFRDLDELSAGNLPKQIEKALDESLNLIVICSPKSALSEWVNKEIETFINLGKTDRIFPFIVDGNSPTEYFPPALLNLPLKEERLGGDVNKNGRDAAFVKVVAGMLGVRFDALWNRYEKEKAEEERKQREQKDNLLKAQSRLIAEKAAILSKTDSHLALKLLADVLPKNLESPNRPYTAEAERVIRNVYNYPNYVFEGHEESVDDISFSPDGKKIASVSHDNTIRLWDVESGTTLWVQDARCSDGKVVFSYDGKTVISSSWSDLLYVWNVENGELKYTLDFGTEVKTNSLEFMSFIGDSQQLLLIDSCGKGVIYNIGTKEIEHIEFDKNLQRVYAATLSPKGNLLAISTSSEYQMYDVIVYEIKYKTCFWGKKRKIVLKECFRTGVKDGVYQLAFDFDNTTLAVQSRFNHQVLIFKIDSSQKTPVKVWECEEGVLSLCFGWEGVLFASVEHEHTMYAWHNGKLTEKYEGHIGDIYKIIICRETGQIASAALDGTIRIWSNTVKQYNQSKDFSGAPFLLADKLLENVNKYSHVLLADYSGPDPLNDTLSLTSSDEKITATCIDENNIKITNRESPETSLILTGCSDKIFCIDISFDNKYVAAGSKDKTIRVWDAENGKCLSILQGHEDYVESIAFNHGSNLVVSTSLDETIRLWDITSGQEIRAIKLYHKKKYMIDTDYRYHSYYIGEGSPEYSALSAVFSPDDRCIIAGFADRKVRVLETNTGVIIQEFTGHSDEVKIVFVTKDGRHIVSLADDKLIKIWNFPPLQEIIDNVNGRFINNQLSIEERKEYCLD